ncbi:MAG: DUF1566 domain-containing protein [Marinobacterium sp.]|nr:DUF1566 domain-containing protein [Marinobacterium sp.]
MSNSLTYTIVDTNQTTFYSNSGEISAPTQGSDFYGQDATYQGVQPLYQNNGDGTITDLNTGLVWAATPVADITYSDALVGADSATTGGYTDWRLPDIKELYSLMDFSGYTGRSADESEPYLDDNYFQFAYGDTSNGERFIDAQYWSSTEYVATTMGGNGTTFGVNFADGRIKGYPNGDGNAQDKESVALYVRGNEAYGENDFADNGDGTITDNATGLMWMQSDSVEAMTWKEALEWAENYEYGGHSDWRLPNAKELQSLVDYERAPDITGSAAIDPLFSATNIGTVADPEYGFYWTGTTHVEGPAGDAAVYLSFGRALGWMEQGGNYNLLDVHGAGAQRSDPKTGDAAEFPYGRGPQGDVIRIENMVRLVRDADPSELDSVAPTPESPVQDDDQLPQQPDTEQPDSSDQLPVPGDQMPGQGGQMPGQGNFGGRPDMSQDRTQGNDRWTAGNADEAFDGGDGLDTVHFGPGRAGFNVQRKDDGQVLVEGNQGSDLLVNVERVHFGDQGVAFDIEGAAGQAYRLYQAAFDRTPDKGGLGAWIHNMDNGMSLEQAGNHFINSNEFQQTYGELDNQGFIRAMYNNVLDRDPDAGGYQAWTGVLDNGGIDRAGVLAGFSESAENQQNVAGQIANGIEFDIWMA